MDSGIIASLIPTMGTIVVAIITAITNKKANKIEDIDKKIDVIRLENKQDMKEHILDADKTYLINFLSDLENGIKKTEIQIKHAYEIYERYTKNRWKLLCSR